MVFMGTSVSYTRAPSGAPTTPFRAHSDSMDNNGMGTEVFWSYGNRYSLLFASKDQVEGCPRSLSSFAL